MKRRQFIQKAVAGGAAASLGAGAATAGPDSSTSSGSAVEDDDVVIERSVSGRPHAGKVLAAIQPHSDDIPLFAAGTVAKLIKEGYTGYLIQTSNDDHAGRGATVGEVVLNNERDTQAVADALGLQEVFHLGYRNHRMDNISIQEFRGRLIFLFRVLKIDTVVSYDPSGHYEENPDHYVTAKAVESACWMAGGRFDYPEHFKAGLEQHSVREKYYFARGPQLVNRVVDIGDVIDVKVAANRANVTQGPAGESGSRLRKRLASENRRLPILGHDDETANQHYIKHIVLDAASQRLRGVPSDAEVGKEYGLEWAERFHYIGPTEDALDKYVQDNAVSF